MLTPASGIAILGFGDDCRRIAAALAPRGCALRVYDPRADQTPAGARLRARIESLGVDVMTDAAASLRAARLVVLDGDCPAATATALRLAEGQLLLDLRRDGPPASSAPTCTGWFDTDGLCLDGAAAPRLAAALSAIGLHSEDAIGRRRPAALAPRDATVPANDVVPAVRRAELP